MTKIYTEKNIDQAAEQLQRGELIAFPTETVFGLGAIANNEEAVKNVYKVKGRPSDNPLIVHIHSKEAWREYIDDISKDRLQLVEQLADKLWPGPLTMVLPVKAGMFNPTVTGGLDTVGLRMPDHPLTLKLIEATGFPLVGPSANLSGKPSPTTVDHVMHDFNGKIAGVLNSAPTRIGVESTVIDLSDPDGIYILRPGYYTKTMIESAVPGIHISSKRKVLGIDETPKAPGMKYRHYSPDLEVIAIERQGIAQEVKQHSAQTTAVAATDAVLSHIDPAYQMFSLGKDATSATHQLFAALRAFDDSSEITTLIIELLPDTEENQAYRNRLLKAASTIKK